MVEATLQKRLGMCCLISQVSYAVTDEYMYGCCSNADDDNDDDDDDSQMMLVIGLFPWNTFLIEDFISSF